MTTLREKYKEAAKEHEKVKASVKEEYAFDKRRIEQAKKAAEYRAEVLKGGKRTIRKAGKKAAKQEKWQMKQDQKAVTKGAKKDSAKNTMKGLLNTSAFKPLLMPLKAFALPLVGMFKIAKNRKKYQMGINRMKDKMIPVVNMAFKFFIFAIVGIISFFLFIKFFMKAFDKLKELGIIDDIKEYVGELIVFGKMIFDTIKTFMDGGFEEGMKKLGPLLDKGISLILEGAMIIAKLAYAFIITGIDMIVDFFTLLWTDKAFRDSVINIGIKVGKMILFAWMVKTLVIAALHLVATLALPFIFFGLGLILLVVAAKIIYNIAKRYGSEVATTLTWWAQKYLNFIIAIRDFLTGGKVVDTIVSKGAKLATWLGTTFTNIIADALSMDIAGNYDKANTAINESGFGKCHPAKS